MGRGMARHVGKAVGVLVAAAIALAAIPASNAQSFSASITKVDRRDEVTQTLYAYSGNSGNLRSADGRRFTFQMGNCEFELGPELQYAGPTAKVINDMKAGIEQQPNNAVTYYGVLEKPRRTNVTQQAQMGVNCSGNSLSLFLIVKNAVQDEFKIVLIQFSYKNYQGEDVIRAMDQDKATMADVTGMNFFVAGMKPDFMSPQQIEALRSLGLPLVMAILNAMSRR